MSENSNMNIIDDNADEDISFLENSKNHILAVFETLEKNKRKEIELQNEKQMLKVENQSKKLELKESQKDNERLLQELEKVKSENQTKNLALNELQVDKENLQKNLQNLQNESDQKDTQMESLKMELIEVKQAIQSFLSGENTIKSIINIVKTSATPEIVPKQSEKVQRAEMSHSNDEEEQISDLLPDQQAVQTPDGQLPTFPQFAVQEQFERVQRVKISYSNEGIDQILDQILSQAVQTPDDQLQTTSEEQHQQPMEVTEHESIIVHPMETLPTQVLSQPVVKTESSCHDENDNTNLQEPEIDLPICNEKDPLEDATTTTMGQRDAEKNSKARNIKKKFKCDDCDASFFGKHALTYHIDKIHIKCDYCEKAFKKKITHAEAHE